MDKVIEKYAARQIPRYTSYPTAPHFNSGVSAATYRKWLGELGEDQTLSLYLHIPFCRSMCWYCGCHTKVTKRYDPVADYTEHLAREIDIVAGAIDARPAVTHVHWGGGSPTILADEDFVSIMKRLNDRFRLSSEAEIAVEIDPRTLDMAKTKALAASGVNRASLGVQDFDAKVQERINRIQPRPLVARSVSDLRAVGIEAISFDLMYGLPGQTVEGCVATVEQAVEMEPDRISVFGYAHVPWMKTHQRLISDESLPDGGLRFEQSEAIAETLERDGYVRVGLDHFARRDDAMAQALAEGNLRRNFQGYTTDTADALIGLGVSAIGVLPRGYVQNTSDAGGYARSLEDGALTTARGFLLDDEDRLRRAVIEKLMCDLEVDLEATIREYGRASDNFTEEVAAMAEMIEEGVVEFDKTTVRMTELGRPVVRAVCALFDSYLGQGRGRHSRAV